MMKAGSNLIAQKARDHDIDAYLAAVFAPPQQRQDLWILQAFAGELARIPLLVHEPMLGEIRLQWWREALAANFRGRAAAHPLSEKLADLMQRAKLPLRHLEGLIDAQSLALEPGGIQDRETINRYIAPDLLELSVTVLSPSRVRNENIATLIASAGRALGVAGLVRRLPAYAAAGRIPLSTELLANAGALAREGLDALSEARARWRAMRGAALLPALLPLALVAPVLQAAARPNADLRRPVAQRPLYRQLRLLTAALSGRF
jgi:phytoene synthase